MSQGLASSNRKYSDDPAEQALCAHIERWTLAYGAALIRLLAEHPDTSLHVLSDFVWDKGVLDLVSPLDFEKRDVLRKAGTGLPWGGRAETELYWRLMYAVCAETSASSEPFAPDPRAAHNPIRSVMSVTMTLLGQLSKPEEGSGAGFLADAFRPGASRRGSALLQELLNNAANQLRLRTGKSVAPKPIEPHARVKIGETVALLTGYGHDGRVLLDRETRPSDPQGLDWTSQPKNGRWQAWAMPWLIAPAP